MKIKLNFTPKQKRCNENKIRRLWKKTSFNTKKIPFSVAPSSVTFLTVLAYHKKDSRRTNMDSNYPGK